MLPLTALGKNSFLPRPSWQYSVSLACPYIPNLCLHHQSSWPSPLCVSESKSPSLIRTVVTGFRVLIQYDLILTWLHQQGSFFSNKGTFLGSSWTWILGGTHYSTQCMHLSVTYTKIIRISTEQNSQNESWYKTWNISQQSAGKYITLQYALQILTSFLATSSYLFYFHSLLCPIFFVDLLNFLSGHILWICLWNPRYFSGTKNGRNK